MSEKIDVKPTLIQRNSLDVAVELTQLYYSKFGMEDSKEVQDIFLKFFAVAETARLINFKDLIEYLPEELAQILEKYK